MNAHERRVFRRELHRVCPPGTLVIQRSTGRLGRVVKRTTFSRKEYNRLMVEAAENPFGYGSYHYSGFMIAPPHAYHTKADS